MFKLKRLSNLHMDTLRYKWDLQNLTTNEPSASFYCFMERKLRTVMLGNIILDLVDI